MGVPLRQALPGGEAGFKHEVPPPATRHRRKQKLQINLNKMGASLDTPTKCPLCNELTREPVTLRCNHQFCPRCIGDLWSVTPTGPYHCPQWRCTTVYQTLPFDGKLLPGNYRWAQPRNTAGTVETGNYGC